LSEEYEEVFDRTKVFALIIGLASVAVLIVFFLTVDFEQIQIPEIQIPIEIPEIEIQEQPVEQTRTENIKPEYQKYIEFGLTEDDIIDIQSMPCGFFDDTISNGTELSTDNKYETIFDQKRTECGYE
jgi:hypothetical protein